MELIISKIEGRYYKIHPKTGEIESIPDGLARLWIHGRKPTRQTGNEQQWIFRDNSLLANLDCRN